MIYKVFILLIVLISVLMFGCVDKEDVYNKGAADGYKEHNVTKYDAANCIISYAPPLFCMSEKQMYALGYIDGYKKSVSDDRERESKTLIVTNEKLLGYN